jgi:NAD(P)-dependent dehydrogenase (short-subunit alcohol dehydrogenase family)
MDLLLTGKTALVTGGSRGIGKAIAHVLAEEGVDVAIAARNPERLRAAAEELAGETGRRIVPLTVDTTDDASVHTMCAGAAAALGPIDILVNNAAAPGLSVPVTGLAGITQESFEPDLNTKVLGYVRVARELAPAMKQRGWGRIINISGTAARNSGNILGSIRNVAVVALTKNLADELGPFGINVTCVHPGSTRTERSAERSLARGVDPAAAEAETAARSPLNRVVDMAEVADVVAFLASPRSVAITGDVIVPNGGAGRAIYY